MKYVYACVVCMYECVFHFFIIVVDMLCGCVKAQRVLFLFKNDVLL